MDLLVREGLPWIGGVQQGSNNKGVHDIIDATGGLLR